MPKLTNRLPSYRHHKASGKAFVELNGHRHYLGLFDSEDSKKQYEQITAKWLAAGRRLPSEKITKDPENGEPAITIAELIAAYFQHVQEYYRDKHGRPTSEVDTTRQALRQLNRLYGDSLACKFGALDLKAVRQRMISAPPPEPDDEKKQRAKKRKREPWSRKYSNKQIGRLRAMFKWAVDNEFFGPTTFIKGVAVNPGAAIYQVLRGVRDLKRGRSVARETQKVKPVPQTDVDAAIPHMAPQVASMVKVQLLTGMRPGEVSIMRTSDIDRSGPIWKFVPEHHKTEHHDIEREISIGPRAQEIITPYLKLNPTAYIFSPADAVIWIREKKHAERKTKMQPSQARRAEEAARRQSKRTPGERYTVASYRRAIERACKKAGVVRWHPHRLRHSAATNFRKMYGLDAARILLGHTTAAVTEDYAEEDREKAHQIMAEVG